MIFSVNNPIKRRICAHLMEKQNMEKKKKNMEK